MPAATEIVRRRAELHAGHGFLDRAAQGPCTAVLEGEADTGETVLWLAVLACGCWASPSGSRWGRSHRVPCTA